MSTTPPQTFVLQSKKLSLAGAQKLARLAATSAQKRHVPGAVAIVDDGGNLILAERWDHTMSAAITIAIDKAITALNFQRPTIELEEAILKGRIPMLHPSKQLAYSPLKGGYPITVDRQIVGAIAIGGTLKAELDEEIVKEVLDLFYQSLD
jgi:glc operon protein GlcG